MKRSEINQLVREAIDFFASHQFLLPPFADWTPEEWKTKGPEAGEIVQCQLGWDVTDFAAENFYDMGLLLFTVRNGMPENLKTMCGKTYAEKIMIVREKQVTPWHFHNEKMEDIINRGGGELVVELANATPDAKLADTPVEAMLDGVSRRVTARGTVTLKPGESITLPPRMYHQFWAREGKGMVLCGEVSRVNDDQKDNIFLEPLGRFPAIEEDETPLRLLVGDYAKYYRMN